MNPEKLTSPHNPWIKAIRKAASRGTLTEDGLCVAEGFHLLEEAVRSRSEIVAILVSGQVPPESVPTPPPSATAAPKLYSVDRRVFREISTTETSQGIVTLVRPRTWTEADVFATPGPTLVLDGLQDPGNAGTIVRAAEAFGASGVIFLKGVTSPFNPKCLRAAAGSLFRLPYVHGVDPVGLRAFLNERHIATYATMPGAGTLLQDAALHRPCAIVIGSEGRGVSPDWTGHATPLRIPTRGVESLNAAVAAAVILYEAQRQRNLV